MYWLIIALTVKLHNIILCLQGVEYNGHFASAAICPVGIDPDGWVAMSR
jgi:hypothetical protein